MSADGQIKLIIADDDDESPPQKKSAAISLTFSDDDVAPEVRYEAYADNKRAKRRMIQGKADPAPIASVIEVAPDPPKYWGGVCQFKPMQWADKTLRRAARHYAVFPHARWQAICLSCQDVIADTGTHDSVRWVIARASDHDRARMNHQIIVVVEGEEFARNDYHPLRSSW